MISGNATLTMVVDNTIETVPSMVATIAYHR
jgi:hypothetical protein